MARAKDEQVKTHPLLCGADHAGLLSGRARGVKPNMMNITVRVAWGVGFVRQSLTLREAGQGGDVTNGAGPYARLRSNSDHRGVEESSRSDREHRQNASRSFEHAQHGPTAMVVSILPHNREPNGLPTKSGDH